MDKSLPNAELQKVELQKMINSEHGINYHKNVNLSGWTFYKGDSFITFRIMDVNDVAVCVLEYIYITCKEDLLQLFARSVDFWHGNNVKYIYYRAHRCNQTVAETILPTLGFSVANLRNYKKWKYKWTSTNGYSENDVIEAHSN